MALNNLIGQRMLVSRMKKILNEGKVGHTYTFSGPAGIGKHTFALAFSRELLCRDSKPETCNCISCRTFQEGTNPDFYEVITNKNSIGVEAIRDLQKDAANRPTYGNRKVYLIPGAELMTVQAQNCLLKTLEEPPEYVVILLTTNSFEVLLPTIRSRTVNFRMNAYTDEDMKSILLPVYSGPPEELEFILKFSRGIPGNAIHIIEEGSVRELRRLIFMLLENPDDLQLADNIRKALTENREELVTVLDVLMSVYRDCLVLKEGMENRLINSDKKGMIKKIASLNSNRKLMDKISDLEKLRRNFKMNINFQLGIDILFMEIQEV